ncbi:hypothetical protein THASP1DRAFT_26278 [Thamnocephalis sphaerospora]|uniref:Uncharacterized protein n=1 Tax=Thamnocephalis sphaerospora TaxID=78915 RepID=A0A4P9XJ09_9FUNG|nr:hypothetical protein THASP1DRAFT_26278 [Thamnocephalis sphaerospora]|eukprot:RKP05180.1 hypothetical protein THASP1DRAFT_26278 [Thamnocephalis sphaerospora]
MAARLTDLYAHEDPVADAQKPLAGDDEVAQRVETADAQHVLLSPRRRPSSHSTQRARRRPGVLGALRLWVRRQHGARPSAEALRESEERAREALERLLAQEQQDASELTTEQLGTLTDDSEYTRRQRRTKGRHWPFDGCEGPVHHPLTRQTTGKVAQTATNVTNEQANQITTPASRRFRPWVLPCAMQPYMRATAGGCNGQSMDAVAMAAKLHGATCGLSICRSHMQHMGPRASTVSTPCSRSHSL